MAIRITIKKDSCLSLPPAVSVVVPAYNVEKYLGKAIESVQAQTFSDWELVIIDDASTDRTLEVALEYAHKDSRITVGQLTDASGSAYIPRRIAVEMAKSSVVAPLDADDYLEHSYLDKLLAKKQAVEAQIVYPTMVFKGKRNVDRLPADLSYFACPGPGADFVKYTLFGWKIGCNGGVFDRDLYLRVSNEYSDELAYSCGDECLTRILLASASVVAISDAQYYYRDNPESITRTTSNCFFDLSRNYVKLIGFVEMKFGRESIEYLLAQKQNFFWIYEACNIMIQLEPDQVDKQPIKKYIRHSRQMIDWKLIRKNVPLRYYIPLRISEGCAAKAVRIKKMINSFRK